jgi:uncharacterized iron-regulated membrane protein
MSVLHTYAGVALGAVLFAVFWMGSLSVFDREIDRWMMPQTRLPAAAPVALDTLASLVAKLAPGAPEWSATLPSQRTPLLSLRVPGADGSVQHLLDPASGARLDGPETRGGTGFLFPFHFMLHIDWLDVGIWLVGLCGMAMLLLVISGVIIHLRIFKDFLLFRPRKAASRSTLDLHTAIGVLALPFHFIMPLSGLTIFFALFFGGTWRAAFGGNEDAFNREVFGSYERPALGVPAPLASLDAMAAEAERQWDGRKPFMLRVFNAGDRNAYVEMRRSYAGDVSMNRDILFFDGRTGAVLERFSSKPIGRFQRFVAGIHFVQFDHWLLRWLYFAGGLSGCVMIATGFLFWLESRRKEHARRGLWGVRVVEALAVGSVTGIMTSTLAYFAANRLIVAGASLGSWSRAELELLVFYGVWLASFVHAGWRGRAAWAEQCLALAGLAALTPVLDWLTTGDHPLRALESGRTSVAVMDGLLLLGAALAAASAWRLRRSAPLLGLRRALGSSAPAEHEPAHG